VREKKQAKMGKEDYYLVDLVFDKTVQWRRDCLFNKWCLAIGWLYF
jgi:hypothetical protein